MPSERPVERPWWVSLGLLGLPTRLSALFFFWLCVVLALGAFITGIVLAIFEAHPAIWIATLIVSVTLLLPAWWYAAAIRWVDRNDRWK